MILRRVVFGVCVVAALCFAAPASAQSTPSPDASATRPAPAAFLWIPLILVAGSVYTVRVFVRPVDRSNRERD